MKLKEIKKQFLSKTGIDLTDHDIKGKFPRLKDGKWGSIERGTAWKMYAEFLESQIIESLQKRVEELEKANDIIYPST